MLTGSMIGYLFFINRIFFKLLETAKSPKSSLFSIAHGKKRLVAAVRIRVR